MSSTEVDQFLFWPLEGSSNKCDYLGKSASQGMFLGYVKPKACMSYVPWRNDCVSGRDGNSTKM